MRQLAAAVAAAACLTAGCSSAPAQDPGPGQRRAAASLPPDPRTASALLKIATTFNNDYDSGDYAPVYARWDARSQAIITRAQYVKAAPGLPERTANRGARGERQAGPARSLAGGL